MRRFNVSPVVSSMNIAHIKPSTNIADRADIARLLSSCVRHVAATKPANPVQAHSPLRNSLHLTTHSRHVPCLPPIVTIPPAWTVSICLPNIHLYPSPRDRVRYFRLSNAAREVRPCRLHFGLLLGTVLASQRSSPSTLTSRSLLRLIAPTTIAGSRWLTKGWSESCKSTVLHTR